MKRKKILIIVLSIFMTISVAVTASVINRTKNNKQNIMEDTETNSKTLIEEVSVEYDKDDYYFNWKNESYNTIDLSKGSNNITKSGVYEITGTLKDGSLIVDVDKKSDNGTVFLVLNGANISSETSAPIYVKNSEKVVLIVENGTENTIYQGSNVTVDESEEPSSAIFSKADLTITGSGKLTVTSNYNDCITSKDKLKITDGNLVLNAKGDGIIGKDLLAVEKANITIVAGKDGMRATNDTEEKMGNLVISDGTFNITSNNDGVYAYSLLQIDGGTFNVTTGGGYVKNTNVNTDANTGASMVNPPKDEKKNTETKTETETESKKGLKASGTIIIKDGEFNISSFDDSIHSNGDVNIVGGILTLESLDDGIHSDSNVNVTSGTVNIKNSYEGVEGKNITIDGGKIDLVSTDDGFNVNDSSGLLTINEGEVYINASGDGVDSNGKINMTGGIVYVDGPVNDGNGAIDYDGGFTIDGGTIIAAGSSGMAQVPQGGTQASILMYYNSAQSGGTITLKDSNDNIVESFKPAKQYSSVAISSSKLSVGSTYTLYKDDTKVVTFELSELTTYIDESGVTTQKSSGPGGQGGPGGPGGPGGQGGKGGRGDKVKPGQEGEPVNPGDIREPGDLREPGSEKPPEVEKIVQ